MFTEKHAELRPDHDSSSTSEGTKPIEPNHAQKFLLYLKIFWHTEICKCLNLPIIHVTVRNPYHSSTPASNLVIPQNSPVTSSCIIH